MGRRTRQIGVCLLIGALAACSSNLTGNVSPDANASPDASPTCPTAQEPADGKITEADRMRFAAAGGSMTVIITVEGGAQSRPIIECRTEPCPERDAVINEMQAENLASQLCVRALIAGTGGTADPTSFWLINAFTATLTWDQIQIVAGHPDVLHIESNGGPPPP